MLKINKKKRPKLPVEAADCQALTVALKSYYIQDFLMIPFKSLKAHFFSFFLTSGFYY